MNRRVANCTIRNLIRTHDERIINKTVSKVLRLLGKNQDASSQKDASCTVYGRMVDYTVSQGS